MEARLKQELPALPATTDPFETLQNTARWCMAATGQDWEDDLIDIKTAASGAPKTILALFAEIATLRADLARERERHQQAMEVVKQYREDHYECTVTDLQKNGKMCECRCPICRKADALLEPEPAPVATGEEK